MEVAVARHHFARARADARIDQHQPIARRANQKPAPCKPEHAGRVEELSMRRPLLLSGALKAVTGARIIPS